MDQIFFVGLLAGMFRLAMPILFAALGETVAQRSGVLNVGIEGIMLVGAFLAAAGSVWTGSPLAGIALAIVGGVALAAIHAYLSITLRIDQILSGIGLTVLGLGLSGYGHRLTIGAQQAVQVPAMDRLDLGALSRLEFVGPILFNQPALIYVGLAAAPLLYWFLYRTSWGLEIRAVGENPAAADSAGVDVVGIRYASVLFGGAMAAIGGAYLSVVALAGFVEDMVAGRGFIAIACVVFGRWNPLAVMLAALFFGMADSAQIRLQALNPDVPYQFFVMMPYALAVVFLVFFAGRAQLPAALAQPFFAGRDKRRREG
ncbi:MAG TPA: ABC transporter permease [Alphaproteobacteria bacterium]